MHILLGLLGAIVTLLVLLHRLAAIGIDLGGLNPFAWHRRRAWRQKFEANPVFTLSDPVDLAALLVVLVAKIDGDMSAEEKRALLGEFETTFELSADKAADLMGSSAHLIGDGRVIKTQLDDVLANCRESFSAAQVDSILEMMERIAHIGGAPSAQQRSLIDAVHRSLVRAETSPGTWG